MEVIDYDLQGHFRHFDLELLEIWLVAVITCNGFELESPNLYQICIVGFSQLVLKMEVIDPDLQGLAIVLTQETAFNVALVYWSRPAKECYTSQTCSCLMVLNAEQPGTLITRATLNAERPLGRLNQYTAPNSKYIWGESPHPIDVWVRPPLPQQMYVSVPVPQISVQI